jgi:hypothetical protein
MRYPNILQHRQCPNGFHDKAEKFERINHKPAYNSTIKSDRRATVTIHELVKCNTIELIFGNQSIISAQIVVTIGITLVTTSVK